MDLHDKIKKLLALSEDSGASEAEAETALNMATALAAKHAIDLVALMTADMDKSRVDVVRVAGTRRTGDFWWSRVALCINELYPIRAYTTLLHDYTLYEAACNVEFSESVVDTFNYIVQQVEMLYKQELPRGLPQGERARFRKNFKWSCASRVLERAREFRMKLESDDGVAVENTGSNALVVVQSREQLLADVNSHLEDVGVFLRKKKAYRGGGGFGAEHGRAAGNRVDLRQSLNGG